MSSFVESLKKAAEKQEAKTAPATAPQSQEELAEFRAKEAAVAARTNAEAQAAQVRVQQLSGTIFARLASSPEIFGFYNQETKQIDGDALTQYFALLNTLAANAARSHATSVWGYQIQSAPAQS